MKKHLTILFALLLLCTSVSAQEYGRDRYELSGAGIYGYNRTFSGYAGLSISGFQPVNGGFEAEEYVEVAGPGVFSFSATARPKFALPVGEIFLDGTAFYRSLSSYRSAEFIAAGSVGYRMNYVSAQFGMFSRTMMDMDRKAHGNENFVSEPFNLLYRVSFQLRPSSSVWNVGGGFSDYSEYEYERMWQPLFFVNGCYRLNEHLRLNAEVSVKPTGMFHLVASFYGVRSSVGLSYIF